MDIILKSSNSLHIISKNSLQYLALKALRYNDSIELPPGLTNIINVFHYGVKCPLDEFYVQTANEIIPHFKKEHKCQSCHKPSLSRMFQTVCIHKELYCGDCISCITCLYCKLKIAGVIYRRALVQEYCARVENLCSQCQSEAAVIDMYDLLLATSI